MNDNDFCKCGRQRWEHYDKNVFVGLKFGCKEFRLKQTFEDFLDETEQGTADWYKTMKRFGQ